MVLPIITILALLISNSIICMDDRDKGWIYSEDGETRTPLYEDKRGFSFPQATITDENIQTAAAAKLALEAQYKNIQQQPQESYRNKLQRMPSKQNLTKSTESLTEVKENGGE